MKKLLSLLLLCAFISGCTTTPQSYNAEANKDIRKIGLIKSLPVNSVDVSIVQHPGANFGLIGATIAIADMAAKGSKYNNKVGKRGWDQLLHQRLKTQLIQAGYQVVDFDIRTSSTAKTAEGFVKSYPKKASVDAFLDYQIDVGQLAQGASTPYIPTARLDARLVKVGSNAVLYLGRYQAGLPNQLDKIDSLPSDVTGYQTFDELMQSAAQANKQLEQEVVNVVQAVAEDLKR